MNFRTKLQEFLKEKRLCVINGVPEDEDTQGKIVSLEDDFVELELFHEAEKQQDSTREKVFIPVDKIDTLSGGAVKVSTLMSNETSETNEKEK